jgi:hypothetical protein
VLRAIEIVALIAVPGALVYGVGEFPKFVRWLGAVVERLRPERPRPQGPPIERLAADLRRISANLDALVAAGPIPGRILRVRSTTAAYDETLLMACRALDVEPAGGSVPMSSGQRLRTEAALANAGLRW